MRKGKQSFFPGRGAAFGPLLFCLPFKFFAGEGEKGRIARTKTLLLAEKADFSLRSTLKSLNLHSTMQGKWPENGIRPKRFGFHQKEAFKLPSQGTSSFRQKGRG